MEKLLIIIAFFVSLFAVGQIDTTKPNTLIQGNKFKIK